MAETQLLKDAGEALSNISAARDEAVRSALWSTNNAMTMCTVLLVFTLIVLVLSTYLLRCRLHGGVVLRVFGTLLVITMVTFLVVAGYDKEQLAAPLGLLGTIVGYLLGRDTSAGGAPGQSQTSQGGQGQGGPQGQGAQGQRGQGQGGQNQGVQNQDGDDPNAPSPLPPTPPPPTPPDTPEEAVGDENERL